MSNQTTNSSPPQAVSPNTSYPHSYLNTSPQMAYSHNNQPQQQMGYYQQPSYPNWNYPPHVQQQSHPAYFNANYYPYPYGYQNYNYQQGFNQSNFNNYNNNQQRHHNHHVII